jgi:hypothetical protein
VSQSGSNPCRATATVRYLVSLRFVFSTHSTCYYLLIHNAELLSNVMTNVEYFNDHKAPTEDKPSWIPWDVPGWNRDKEFKEHGDPGRQRLTQYAGTRPYLRHGENSADDHRDWYHKRNFTLILVNANANNVNFPGSNFASGSIPNPKSPQPVTTIISGSTWIMCAVSVRGQQRFKFRGNINGYCWDGQSTSSAASGHFTRQRYFGCRIDFVGAAFVNRKRAEPIGYFHDEAVYGIERVDDAETIVVDVPVADAMLPNSKFSFPLS